MATETSTLMDIETNTMFDWVPIEKTIVAPYGRFLSEAKVEHLVSTWNPKAFGVALLSWRHLEEVYAILDGQHRTEAARRVGMDKIPARIYIDLTYREEADLYVRFATVNKQTAVDRFRARLEAGDPVVLDLHAILTGLNLEVPPQQTGALTPHQIACVFTLERVYQYQGREILSLALHTLHDAWKGRQRGYSMQAVEGAAAFWARYQGQASMSHLIDVLHRNTPDEVAVLAYKTQEVMGQMQAAYAWGRVFLRLYNNRMKSPLPEWQDHLLKETHEQRSARANKGWATRRTSTPEEENNG